MKFILNNFGHFGFILIIGMNSLFLYIINYFFFKKKIFLDNSKLSIHKSFINKNQIPLSGGFLILFSIIVLSFFNNYLNLFLSFVLFFIGSMSDIGKLNSTKIRFFLQILIIFLFFIINDFLLIKEIKLEYFDLLLNEYKIISLLFTCFCILILINGSNFIDGTNLQCSGYFFAISLVLILSTIQNDYIIDTNKIYIIFLILFTFIKFNIFNKSFLGDGGTYLLSFIIGIILIEFFVSNNVSPYFIALLLWYPAFENFFSIIRRLTHVNKNIDKPDNFHLHHLIFLKIIKSFKNKFLVRNSIGFTIFLYNIIIFYIGANYIFESKVQIFLILFSITFYLLLYKLFSTTKKKIK